MIVFIFLIFSSTFKFQYFISTAATTPHEFLITDDFNLHTDNHSNLLSQQFPSLINNANLIQHVNFSTHQAGHTLDLVITAKDHSIAHKYSLTHFTIWSFSFFQIISISSSIDCIFLLLHQIYQPQLHLWHLKLCNSTQLPNLTNQNKIWNTINKLLHRIVKPTFATFLKIHNIRSSILSGTTIFPTHLSPAFKPYELLFYHPAATAEVSTFLSIHFLWSWSNSYLAPQIKQIWSSHDHKYRQSISVHWSLSWSIQKLFCTFTSHKIQPWQRKRVQLYKPRSHLSYLLKLTELTEQYIYEHQLANHLNKNSFQSASLNSTELKPLYLLYMTMLSEPWVDSK